MRAMSKINSFKVTKQLGEYMALTGRSLYRSSFNSFRRVGDTRLIFMDIDRQSCYFYSGECTHAHLQCPGPGDKTNPRS